MGGQVCMWWLPGPGSPLTPLMCSCTYAHVYQCAHFRMPPGVSFSGCNVPSASGGCSDALDAFLSDSLVTETDGDALGIFTWLFV